MTILAIYMYTLHRHCRGFVRLVRLIDDGEGLGLFRAVSSFNLKLNITTDFRKNNNNCIETRDLGDLMLFSDFSYLY